MLLPFKLLLLVLLRLVGRATAIHEYRTLENLEVSCASACGGDGQCDFCGTAGACCEDSSTAADCRLGRDPDGKNVAVHLELGWTAGPRCLAMSEFGTHCKQTIHSNGFLESFCDTTDLAYRSPCARTGVEYTRTSFAIGQKCQSHGCEPHNGTGFDGPCTGSSPCDCDCADSSDFTIAQFCHPFQVDSCPVGVNGAFNDVFNDEYFTDGSCASHGCQVASREECDAFHLTVHTPGGSQKPLGCYLQTTNNKVYYNDGIIPEHDCQTVRKCMCKCPKNESVYDYTGHTDWPTANPGLEPDGVSDTCEHYAEGRAHVTCCRNRAADGSLQCTAMHHPERLPPLDEHDCITNGPNRDGVTDGMFRQKREWMNYPFLINGKVREKPNNQSFATFAYAKETCENLDGGDQGWRLCQPEEVSSGACCHEEAGVSTCGYADMDVWTDKYCDSWTTCSVVEGWMYVRDTSNRFRGEQLTAHWENTWCEYDGEGQQYSSNREHLCEWFGYSGSNVASTRSCEVDGTCGCLPKVNVKIMDDNTGDRGYNVYLFASALATFPHAYEDQGTYGTPTFHQILANMTPAEATTWEDCAAHSSGITKDYCVEEVAGLPVPASLFAGIGYEGENLTLASLPVPSFLGSDGSAGGGRRLEEKARRRRLSTWAAPVVIAFVMDTGTQPQHEIFNMGENVLPGFNAYAGADNGHNGWIDHNGHGTHVGGIVRQANVRVRIVPVNIFSKSAKCTTSDVVAGLEFIHSTIVSRMSATNSTERYVVNMSICARGDPNNNKLQKLLNSTNELGAMLFTAACNTGSRIATRPYGNYNDGTTTYTIASRGATLKLSPFSGWDSFSDGIALGEDVLSAKAKTSNGYERYSGTSQATPWVTGVVSRLLEIHPDFTSDQIWAHYDAHCTAARIVGVHPDHFHKKSGGNVAPYSINDLNAALPNCYKGTVVPCFDVDGCSEASIAAEFGVAVGLVEKLDYVPYGTATAAYFIDEHESVVLATAPVQTMYPTTPPPTNENDTFPPTSLAPTFVWVPSHAPTVTPEAAEIPVVPIVAGVSGLALVALAYNFLWKNEKAPRRRIRRKVKGQTYKRVDQPPETGARITLWA